MKNQTIKCSAWTRLELQNYLFDFCTDYHDSFPDSGGPFRDTVCRFLDEADNEVLHKIFNVFLDEWCTAMRHSIKPILTNDQVGFAFEGGWAKVHAIQRVENSEE